jgi:hypothetical protein
MDPEEKKRRKAERSAETARLKKERAAFLKRAAATREAKLEFARSTAALYIASVERDEDAVFQKAVAAAQKIKDLRVGGAGLCRDLMVAGVPFKLAKEASLLMNADRKEIWNNTFSEHILEEDIIHGCDVQEVMEAHGFVITRYDKTDSAGPGREFWCSGYLKRAI